MRFSESTPIPDSCLFGLVETSFQRAVKLYELECQELNKRAAKVSLYDSELKSDGFTWVLFDEEGNPVAYTDSLHNHVSLEWFPVAGSGLPDDPDEIRQPYRDKTMTEEIEERMAVMREKQSD